MVSTSSGVRSSYQACCIRCKNLALNIRDCISLVRRGSSVVRAPLPNLGKFVIPHCLCLSDVTLTAVGPFYLVSIQEEVKYPVQGVNVQPGVDSTM